MFSEENGFLTFNDFKYFVSSHSFVLDIFYLLRKYCFIHLGVRPLYDNEERDLILQLKGNSGILCGHEYYLISSKWFKTWAEYVSLLPSVFKLDSFEKEEKQSHMKISKDSKKFLSSIDNSKLIQEIGKHDLILNLRESVDYVLVNADVWNVLSKWYGGGPKLSRKAIKRVEGSKEVVYVEIYLLSFVVEVKGLKSKLYLSVSRANTIQDLKERICNQLNYVADDLVIWDLAKKDIPRILDRNSLTVEEYGLIHGQELYFDIRTEDGKFQGYKNVHVPTEEESIIKNVGAEEKKLSEKGDSSGIVGLSNIGNTCFMNSTLQCLSLSRFLTDYFLKNFHLWELNTQNPLGMEGKVALSYGSLVHRIYKKCTKFDVIAPRGIKSTIGKFAPQFVGFQQHDSHEFLQFLLDGLHEGLNRVHEKPYIEIQDSKGRPDKIVADEQWDAFLKRNQSIIVDLFMGQLKSTLRWNCGRENVKFDPYSVLSLPLSKPSHRSIEITIVFDNAARIPIKYTIEIINNASIKDLKQELSNLSNIPASSLYLVELFNSSAYQSLNIYGTVDSIRPNDIIYAYEIPKTLEEFERKSEESDFSKKIEIDSVYEAYSETHKKWSNASVKELEEDRILFEFQCCPEKCKNWIPKNSELYRPLVPKTNFSGSVRNQLNELSSSKSLMCINICQRLRIPQDDYFFNPIRPSVFGIPLILFIDAKNLTAESLYQKVWQKLYRYTSGIVESDYLMESPFVLCRVKKNSSQCSQCSWMKLCLGCEIQLGIKKQLQICHEEHIAVDWNPLFYEKYLDVQDMTQVRDFNASRKMILYSQKKISLQSCMNQFIKPENLEGDASPYCSDCKAAHSATKVLQPWSAPPILIIHLKRLIQGTKIATFVDFPLKGFDPNPFLSKEVDENDSNLYDLYAVVNHYGNAASGHYVTYGLHSASESWFCFDDSRITRIDEKDVCSKNAYMLFYLRRGFVFDDVLNSSLKEKVNAELPEELRMIAEEHEKESQGLLTSDVCPWFVWPAMNMPKKLTSLFTSKKECSIS